ncbi:hypothetical protein D3C80_448510 [compost metagenome]
MCGCSTLSRVALLALQNAKGVFVKGVRLVNGHTIHPNRTGKGFSMVLPLSTGLACEPF